MFQLPTIFLRSDWGIFCPHFKLVEHLTSKSVTGLLAWMSYLKKTCHSAENCTEGRFNSYEWTFALTFLIPLKLFGDFHTIMEAKLKSLWEGCRVTLLVNALFFDLKQSMLSMISWPLSLFIMKWMQFVWDCKKITLLVYSPVARLWAQAPCKTLCHQSCIP